MSCLLSGVFFICLVFLFAGSGEALAAADHVLINEIQTDSVVGSGGTSDDWIELYNPTDSAIVLDGWSIQKHAASATSTITKKALSGTIPAKGYYLIVRGDTATAQALKDKADILTASSFSLSNDNTVYLVKNDVLIDNKNDADIIDYVGYGSVESFEGGGPAANPQEAKSIVRKNLGEDSNDNAADFTAADTPTPSNAKTETGGGSDMDGTVLLTVVPGSVPVANISPSSADISFVVNAEANARLSYGTTSSYGLVSAAQAVIAGTESKISITGLSCGTSYHYSVYAETADKSDSHATADAVFATLPCGLKLDSLVMTKSSARADNNYADGWRWEMKLTVWDIGETMLKMKFGAWSGPSPLAAAGNMRYSVDGTNWKDIAADGAYPNLGLDISGADESVADAGRQLKISIEMKLPVGTKAGGYSSSYGVLTEKPGL